MDIGLASSKTLQYSVTGKPGETKLVTVKVTSVETGKTGKYMDITVVFPEDGSKPTAEDEVNSKIFSELLVADAEEPMDTSEDTPGTVDTVEPDHTEPTPANTTHTDPVEPDPGISVD